MGAIEEFIDRKIIEVLVSGRGWDDARTFLYDNYNNYTKSIVNLRPDETMRKKKLTEYTLHAKKRILDLYFIEVDWADSEYDRLKKFRLLLFKEKLEGK